MELRGQAAIKRKTNASRLPNRTFDLEKLKPGIAWQVEQLETLNWIEEEQNLVIITNRELSAWISAAEDTHLMQTLVDRITSNSQIIRLG